ncbi:MAG TPA: hypothetical protein VF533_15760 [Solirubrobacteraceae bacterium]|jgi:hypothetical protein
MFAVAAHGQASAPPPATLVDPADAASFTFGQTIDFRATAPADPGPDFNQRQLFTLRIASEVLGPTYVDPDTGKLGRVFYAEPIYRSNGTATLEESFTNDCAAQPGASGPVDDPFCFEGKREPGTYSWQIESQYGGDSQNKAYSAVRTLTIKERAARRGGSTRRGGYRTGDPSTGGHGSRRSAFGPLKAGEKYTTELRGHDWYYFYVRKTATVTLRHVNTTPTGDDEDCTIGSFCVLNAGFTRRGPYDYIGRTATQPEGGGDSDSIRRKLRRGKYYIHVSAVNSAKDNRGTGETYELSVRGPLTSKRPR